MGGWSRAEALERLSTQTTDLLCAIGFDGHFKYMNPAFERLLGFTIDELTHLRAAEIIHPDDLERTRTAGKPLAEGGGSVALYETRCITKDGTVRWLQWSATTIYQEQLIYCVARDITEQKKIAEELQVSEARYRFLAEHLTDMVGRYNLQGHMIDQSGAHERMLGYTGEELRGTDTFSFMHPDDHAGAMAAMGKIITEGGIHSAEYRLKKKNGEYLWVESAGRAVRDPVTGQPTEIVGVTRDISERRRAEEKQRLLEQQLHQAQKMEAIGRLAGGIAHDFNNLLSAILGFTHVALETLAIDAPERISLEEVTKAGQRAADLVKQLLLFSRRQNASSNSVLEINDAIRELDRIMRRLIGEHIEVTLQVPAEKTSVRLDEAQLSQVLVNLCVNARDAMPRGGKVTITSSIVSPDSFSLPPDVDKAKHGWALVTVADTGHGMSEEVRAHAFEPFYTTKAHGTGLGLAAVYGVMRGAGGFVDLQSEVGKGTRFNLYFPICEAPITSAVQRPLETQRTEGQTILVAEDEDLVREVIRKVLTRAHYRVLTARDGVEALEILEKTPDIDLLVTDAVMPMMGGPELIERTMERWPDLRVLLISGYASEAAGDRRVKTLPKPFTPSELAGAVRSLLEKKLASV